MFISSINSFQVFLNECWNGMVKHAVFMLRGRSLAGHLEQGESLLKNWKFEIQSKIIKINQLK